VLTIPNLISVVRLALVPVFLWLLWGKDEPVAAAALLAFLGATDWVDGYIARHFDQGSELGKILDPTADRVLLVAGAIALLVEDVPAAVTIVVWVVLIREVLIAGATITLALAGARRIDVVWAGKAGTLAIMFALPLFLWADAIDDDALRAFVYLCGWGFAIGGIVLGYYAAWKYIPAAREAVREGRAARVATEVQA
jgi:cardiolipin synthase